MFTHKNQHFLPCAYLRHFSVDGSMGKRRSMIWRTDAIQHMLRSVESQCSRTYFYSRASASEVEAAFAKMEAFYGQISGKFWRQENPRGPREYFGLLVMMLDLHIRNAAYAQRQEENYRDYLVRTSGVRNQILFGQRGTPSTDAEVIDLWQEHWGVRIVDAAPNRSFLTSDNPSLWFRAGDDFGEVHLILMPVTPHSCAIAFDRRVFDFVPGTTTEEDEKSLNQLQIRHRVECVFSAEQLSAEQLAGARKLFAKGTNPPANTDAENTWTANILQFPDGKGFSFVRRK